MKSIELFAGAGGLGIGVSRAGFTPIEVVEWDRWCQDTILENRNRGIDPVTHWPHSISGDVREVSFKDFEGKIDLISGGPPCQPFSLGGKHQAFRDSRDMFPEAVRAVREARPAAFIFENVKGLKRATFLNYFQYIVLQLSYPSMSRMHDESWVEHLCRLELNHTGRHSSAEIEYRVVAHSANAANFGIPQRRERIFFIGFRADLGVSWAFPNETHSLDALLWDQIRDGDYWERHRIPIKQRQIDVRHTTRAERMAVKPETRPWVTVRDSICDLPDPELQPGKAKSCLNHFFQPGARSYAGHTGSPLDEPAKTLKAGVHGVPGGENMLRRPDGGVRYFSVRESARLQTFPDDYAFHGSWSEAMRQLGNAVPVNLAELVANSVKEALVAQCVRSSVI